MDNEFIDSVNPHARFVIVDELRSLAVQLRDFVHMGSMGGETSWWLSLHQLRNGQIQRIDVIRGAASSIYRTDAMGSVIKISRNGASSYVRRTLQLSKCS